MKRYSSKSPETGKQLYFTGMLETDESFEQIEAFIVSEIEAIKKDPDKGRTYLYKTGMYDKDGHVKPEFVNLE